MTDFSKAGANDYKTLHQQAMQALRAGRLSEGIPILERVLRGVQQGPVAGSIHNDLGMAYWQSGNTDEAKAHFRKAVKLAAQNPFVFNCYGSFLLSQRQLDEAAEMIKRAAQLKPDHPEIQANLGLVHYRKGAMAEAEKCFVAAINLNPNWPVPHAHLGNVLRDTRRRAPAEKAYQHALKLNPNNPAVWADLGDLYFALRREKDCADCYRRAISIDPSHDGAWVKLLDMLEKTNALDEANETLAKAKTRFPSSLGILAQEAKLLRRAKKDAEALALMESLAPRMKELPPNNALFVIEFFFELGQLHDLANDAEKAFACFTYANSRQAATPDARQYDKTAYVSAVKRLQDAAAPLPARTGDAAPVFLVGFPRSGTTLLDQILSSHPAVRVTEEKPVVDKMLAEMARMTGNPAKGWIDNKDYPAALGALTDAQVEELRGIFHAEHGASDGKLLVDKLPLNMLHAGFIRRVFPGAKFILALRHPCDSVLSCYMQRFALNAAMVHFLDLKDAARLYDEAFTLWHKQEPDAHIVKYEDVVGDFRATVKATLDYLGLPWDEAVMEYDKTAKDRGVINTPSYRQVTEKIYTRASGRWLRYRAQLAPVLGTLAPHAEKLAYAMDDAREDAA
ncbi:MAG: sulfotransferase [Alphaproteobacteria bacterium]